jgi:molybdate transport system substrate-binding protein
VSLAPEANLALLLEGKEPNAFFAVGDPEYVAQGEFAKEALTELELYNQLEPFFVFLRDEYQVMNTISKFEVYGITYLTEVTKNPKLKVIDIFPDSSHDPIYYDAVVVAGENMPPARKFVEYLAQPEAQAIFVKHGLGLKNL